MKPRDFGDTVLIVVMVLGVMLLGYLSFPVDPLRPHADNPAILLGGVGLLVGIAFCTLLFNTRLIGSKTGEDRRARRSPKEKILLAVVYVLISVFFATVILILHTVPMGH